MLPCEIWKVYYSWFCCLAPLEAITLTGLVAIRVGAMIDFVTKANFDDAWTTLGGVVDDPRYKNFVLVYHLRLETVEIDGEEIELYMMDDEWWFLWLLFAGCPEFDINCPDGCFELEYGR